MRLDIRTLAILALGLPATVLAQPRWTLAPYVATDRTLPGAPTIYGAAITSYHGLFGLRASGALSGLRTTVNAGGASTTHASAWTADGDLVFSPARHPAGRALLGGLEPSFFAGIGTHGVRTALDERLSAPAWSWGVSLSQPIFSRIALETEARRRSPIDYATTFPAERFERGWEYRAGLALRFGGGRDRTRAPSRGPSVSSGGRARTPARRYPTSAPSAPSAAVLNTADDYLGTRYVYGGTTPDGFDCSGFVQYVFRRHGVMLPRTSRQMAQAGETLPAAVRSLRAGDLMLFAGDGARVDHVAIYAGNGRIIHSSSSGSGVRYDDLSTPRGQWFEDHLVAARRVMSGGRSLFDANTLRDLGPVELDPPDAAPRR